MAEKMDTRNLYAKLPSVDQALKLPEVEKLCLEYSERYVHNCVRKAVDEVRRGIAKGLIGSSDDFPSQDEIVVRIRNLVQEGLGHKLLRAINGAGVILHTGLGRAPLAPAAQEALMEATRRYCILATERETGKRGDRNRHTAEMLRELTGAEDSLVVNNNSAAVILALNTFGNGSEAIVSRGELVEIGGAFRIPDVMMRSGTIMVGVGTTNKTHLRDYREAVTEHTAVLLKVHTSNYRIEGFHQEVAIKDLRSIADEYNLVIIHDIGSGALVDVTRWGLAYEPTVPAAVAEGADIITFSGDKMLGGPQCGVIVGKRVLIERMKRNPWNRAFRCDKLTLSALNGTLKLFLEPDTLPLTHPIYRMMTENIDSVNRRARRIARLIREIAGDLIEAMVEAGATEMGSGSLPVRPIPSRVVSLVAKNLSAERLALSLRLSDPPLFTRIEGDRVVIDARTIADDEVRLLRDIFRQCGSDRFDPSRWSNRAMSAAMRADAEEDERPALG